MTPEAEVEIFVRLARLEEQFAAARDALDIQTSELARRLDDLNHAARRREERDATFVPRETYEADTKALAAAVENKTKHLAEDVGSKDRRIMALERWQSMVVGGMILAMAIGVTNFIRLLWVAK